MLVTMFIADFQLEPSILLQCNNQSIRKNCLIKDLADLVVLILFLVDACKICKEHIRWICSRCNKSEDVTHKHRESVDDIII